MFSHTVMRGKSARFWKMRAVGRLFGPIPAMFLPPIRTSPSEGSRKPETARSRVVLPQPEGPRKLKNRLSAMSMVTSRAATKSPNLIHTPSSSTPALIACSPSWWSPLVPQRSNIGSDLMRNVEKSFTGLPVPALPGRAVDA